MGIYLLKTFILKYKDEFKSTINSDMFDINIENIIKASDKSIDLAHNHTIIKGDEKKQNMDIKMIGLPITIRALKIMQEDSNRTPNECLEIALEELGIIM